jgi:phosphatidylglycerophosphate synthase
MMAAGLAFLGYRWISPWWAAVAVAAALAANWFGDSLDGTVARVRGQQRPRYGYYVDHVMDLAGATMLMAGLGGSALMSPIGAAVLLAGYLLVSAETYLATHSRGVFRMASFGVGPTELRVLLAAGAARAAMDPWVTLPAIGAVRLFDVGAVVAASGMTVAFVVASVRNTRALYLEEPMPGRIHEPHR